MTEREKFAKEYSLHTGISVESVKFDDYGKPYIDTPYVTNVIPNTMVQSAYWGWQAATKAAVPEGWELVPIAPTYEMFCAGYHGLEKCELIEIIYKSMLAAAPEVK